jgi:uncharacterized protein (DUF3820 family)
MALWTERPGLIHECVPLADDAGDVTEMRTACGRTCDPQEAEALGSGEITCRSCCRAGGRLAGRVREGAADRPAWWRELRFDFGKYRNWRVTAVPTPYLVWAWRNLPHARPQLRLAIAFTLEARGAGDADTAEAVRLHQATGVLLGDVDAVIAGVQKEMAKEFRPDLFRDGRELDAANTVLRRIREQLGLA